MTKILLLQGPNLNLLGTREPDVYGKETLETIHLRLQHQALTLGVQLECYQSNAEHQLLDKIHQARAEQVDFILINPAAFTHTSVALRDALAGVGIPFIEIHLSNVHAREPFRRHSYFSDLAEGVICGLGSLGYDLALQAAYQRCEQHISS
ncbi:type II 3-dehydroquinate dehydratase [Marinospirillum sp. MEB164]|uniref:3-dehydroquinate dehydratase n=1 Tax=Marinospirillum alkalitolerans TaxID=3123374 RepID=A0ABW8Q110_9GAMM